MSEDNKKFKILIVDDEPGMLALLKDILSKEELHIETASNVIEARNLLNADCFDLILCDIFMPHLDGVEFISKLRLSSNKNAASNIIAMTGFATPAVKAALKKAGVHEIYEKPFDYAAFQEKIKSLPFLK